MIDEFMEKGEVGEQWLLPIIQSKYPKAYKRKMGESVLYDGDIFIPELHCNIFDCQLAIEVKVEYTIKLTNQIVIEAHSMGHDSGITTSKSKWWCIICPYTKKYWLIDINKLKDLIGEYSTIKDDEGCSKNFKYVTLYNQYCNTAIRHNKEYILDNGMIQDLYFIPVPLFQLYCVQYDYLNNFNIDDFNEEIIK
jgi:hypothetical protein